MDKKQLNKILVGLFLGSAIGGATWFSKSKKGKSLIKNIKTDIKEGLKEMQSFFQNLKKKHVKKK